jgi:hypothetical protein
MLAVSSTPRTTSRARRQVVGPGFRYTANTGFHGEDSFSVEVRGFAGKMRGASTIRIAVSVKEQKTPTTSAPRHPSRRPGETTNERQLRGMFAGHYNGPNTPS